MSRGSVLMARAVELYGDESFRAGWEEGLIDPKYVHGLIAHELFRNAPSLDTTVRLEDEDHSFCWSYGDPPEGANVKTKLSPDEYLVFAASRQAATKLCQTWRMLIKLLGEGGSISAQHAFYRPPQRRDEDTNARLQSRRLGLEDLQVWWAFSLFRADDPVGVVVHAWWRNLTQLQRAFRF